MGLIRVVNDSGYKSNIIDLSDFYTNQLVLNEHLNALLWIPGNRMINPLSRSQGNSLLNLPSPSSFHSFTPIPLNSSLNFETLLAVYREQYSLLERAIVSGCERRRLFYENRDEGFDSALDVSTFEEVHQMVMTMARRRKTPDQLEKMVQKARKEARPGDIIDIAGYRGKGYYFIWKNDESGLFNQKTLGRNGCYLPACAWEYIAQHGYQYFEKADVWGCYLPGECKVKVIQQGNVEQSEPVDNMILSWLHKDAETTIEVDGNPIAAKLVIPS